MKKIIVLSFLSLVFFLVHCSVEKKEKEKAPEIELVNVSGNIKLPADLLTQSEPPFDVAKEAGVLEHAIFAWREIISLSWKSTYTEAVPQRGTPDPSWNYSQGTPTDPLVWETFAHRTEYRPKGDIITRPYDSQPNYTFINNTEVDWNGIDQADHFVMLDEDNEIGSCYVFTEPNITKSEVTDNSHLVMYMAKTNRAEYDYRKQYFNDSISIATASNRVASDKTNDYAILKDISLYNSPDPSDPCGSAHFGEQGLIVFPCSDEASSTHGAMEIKTAWRPLTGNDNRSEFLVREAVSFTENSSGVSVAQVDEYVLIGIHIIHKTNNFRHFFIATWEHNSVESYGYQYVVNPPSPSPAEDFKVLPVERHDDSDGAHSRILETYNAISTAVQAKIKAANPGNFLANYRLTGFQSDVYPNASLADRKQKMPAYYLANLVIESDDQLTDFSGSFAAPYSDQKNIVAGGQYMTSGGCSGCHGQAQLGGTDFSFITDVGVDKPVPEPDKIYLSPVQLRKVLNQ